MKIADKGIELTSQAGNVYYLIDGQCSCESSFYRGENVRCKHRTAAIEAGLLPPVPALPEPEGLPMLPEGEDDRCGTCNGCGMDPFGNFCPWCVPPTPEPEDTMPKLTTDQMLAYAAFSMPMPAPISGGSEEADDNVAVLSGIVGRRLAEGWSWVPNDHGHKILLPPEGDPRRDIASIWWPYTKGHYVPNWANDRHISGGSEEAEPSCPDCGRPLIDGVACECKPRRGPEAGFPDYLDSLAGGIEGPHTERGEPMPEVAGALYDAADEIRRARGTGVSSEAEPQAADDVLAGLEGFTPGEWEVVRVPIESRGGSNTCFKIGPFHACIYDDGQQAERGISTAANIANARLIARAPKLVAEIRRLRAKLDALAEGDPAGTLRRFVEYFETGARSNDLQRRTLLAIADAIDRATT